MTQLRGDRVERGGAPSPILSMTGSGVCSGVTELGDTAVQVRAVNGRALAVKTRLGPECQSFEDEIERAVRARLNRGTVTVTMEVTSARVPSLLTVDEDLAEQALSSLRALAARLGYAAEAIDLRMLLSIPGVVQNVAGRSRLATELPVAAAALLQRALDDLITHRRAEGAAIVGELHRCLDLLEAARESVVARLPAVVRGHRERLLQRVNEFLVGRAQPMQDADVVREVALFADRADVSEEVQRIGEHVRRVRELLAAGGEVGRRLEFVLQEILREVNTLGSKSPDVEVASCTVEMKSAIDKLKEQVANLE